jgi:acetyl esterase/lipase
MLGGCEVLRASSPEPPRARVLHLHGGGYRMGMPEMDAPFAEALAGRCGVEVILPRYRLAPEHPFPAGLNDALAALDALPADMPVILSGGSAGGGLAAALAALCGPGIAGLALLSPWLDLRLTAPSLDANAASDPLFSREAATLAAELYLQGHDPADPLASPVLADTSGFPPTLIAVGTGEVLLDDSRTMAARLERAGIAARLIEVPGMDHVAVTRDSQAIGAADTFAALTSFIDERLA